MVDETCSEYQPETNALSDVANVRLPGEKCFRCRSQRMTMLKQLGSVFEVISTRYSLDNGKKHGIVVGLFGDKSSSARPMWFDVAMIQKRPVKLLGANLHDTALIRGTHGLLGEFDYPAEASIHVPDVTLGRDNCLLQNWFSVTGKPPKFVVFLSKKGIEATDNGWVMKFSPVCDVTTIRPKAKQKDKPYTDLIREESENLRRQVQAGKDALEREKVSDFNTLWRENLPEPSTNFSST